MEMDNLGGPAEQLPVEVIGDILSRVRVARDVIKASLTCKKWREAYRKHLYALSFEFDDECPHSIPEIKMLITNTICQSPRLRKLSILIDINFYFPDSLVMAWLMLARKTLSELVFRVQTSGSINVLDMCERQKMETLSLRDYTITGVGMNFERFPCLTSLSLCRASISVEDLNRFLCAFPKLESLNLDDPFSEASDDEGFSPERIIEVHCPTLKTLSLGNMKLFQFVLENSSIEYLQMKHCYFCLFKVSGSKTLKGFKILYSEAPLLEIGETDNLESFESIFSHVTESLLFLMMKQSPKLETLRFLGFKQQQTCPLRGEENILDGTGLVLDLERMAICSPQLTRLAIFCDGGLDGVLCRFGSSTSWKKVVVLEIGWDRFDGYIEWAEELLECCPNVKKLIVHWVIPGKSNPDYLKDLTKKSSSMVEMMRKYQHIQMQFSFIYEFA